MPDSATNEAILSNMGTFKDNEKKSNIIAYLN